MWTVTWLQLWRRHGEVDINNNTFLFSIFVPLKRSSLVWLLFWSDPSLQGEVEVRWCCNPTPPEWSRDPQPNQSGWHSAAGCSLSQQPPQDVYKQGSYGEPRKEATWYLWQCRKHQLWRQEGLPWGPPAETSARGYSSQQPRGPQITGDRGSGWGKAFLSTPSLLSIFTEQVITCSLLEYFLLLCFTLYCRNF